MDTLERPIECLFSHHCDAESHDLGYRIAISLVHFGLRVGVDNLCVGDSVRSWMISTEFQALIFAGTPESWASDFCMVEMEAAQARSAPIFVLRVCGPIPAHQAGRLWLELEDLREPAFSSLMERLGSAIRDRVEFVARVRQMVRTADPLESAEAARDLAVVTRPVILSENADVLARHFGAVQNAQLQYWLARAIGRAATPQALGILQELKKSSPGRFALTGVEEAIEAFETRVDLKEDFQ